MLVADKGLVIESLPSAETASFSSKERCGGCCKRVVVRGRVSGFAGELYSVPMAFLQCASSCVRLPSPKVLHAGRPAHGIQCCEHASVQDACRSPYHPLVRALAVCGQTDYLGLSCGPESTFRPCKFTSTRRAKEHSSHGPRPVQMWACKHSQSLANDCIRCCRCSDN